jgi:hypothetical protein
MLLILLLKVIGLMKQKYTYEETDHKFFLESFQDL